SSWYAIDSKGHVALFITGAGGAAPNDAYSPEATEMMEELGEEVGEVEVLDAGRLPDQRRVFVYETGQWDECLADRYHRRKVPKNPLHVDELPSDVRWAIRGACFDTLDFSETKVFQPVELTECGSWDPAYLSSDGKTVKPVPGREKEYAEHIAELRN